MKKPFAIITLTHNEAFFLRVWCNYYCPLFSPENVYVLDHASQDGSVTAAEAAYPGIHVSSVDSGVINDHAWMRDVVQSAQAALLEDYEVVVYAETDEFLISGQDESLMDYLERFRADPGQQFVRATAWHIIHQFTSGESHLRPVEGQTILEDRNSMWRLPSYDKTLVTKVPLSYEPGFHSLVSGGPSNVPDADLILLHAWMVDLAMYRNKRRVSDATARLAFLTRQVGQFVSTGAKTPIPERWKEALVW